MLRTILILCVTAVFVTLAANRLIINKTDGSSIAIDIDEIENVTFLENPVWVTESVEAVNTQQVIFYSETVEDSVSFHIYLPNEYQAEPYENFPVLYWLHGSGPGLAGIPILANFFHNAMQRRNIPPMIIVFPHGLPHGMWCDSIDGRQPVESMFINDLLPYIDENFRTIRRREGRVVEGFSMGGYGAARFGFKFYELFGGFSLFGAGPLQLDLFDYAPENKELQIKVFREVFGNDIDYFIAQSPWRLAEQYGHLLPHPTLKRQIIGTEDFTYQANLEFHEHLDELDIPHQYREFEGIGHNVMRLFNALGNVNWAFYNAVFDR